jgi:hypothetical protein
MITKSSIDLIYYESSPKLDVKKEIYSQIPIENFTIDNISLIKGIPRRYRPGTPSMHDEMHLEEMTRYKFPLSTSQ